ncbi:hypothetical protein LTS18_004858, partial [Coniosporium uncinatum]
MTTDCELWLQIASTGEPTDAAEWPLVLEHILARLFHIIESDFPKPPPKQFVSDQAAAASQLPTSSAFDKENAPPASPPTSRPADSSSSPHQEPATSSAPVADLPEPVPALYTSVRRQFEASFSKQPPHTLQRLAELVLRPTQHYKHLPPYLRALDRVVAVSSPSTIFPLPQAELPRNSGLLNGASSTPSASSNSAGGLGSDESLGGALLTPIPWLDKHKDDEGRRGSGASGTGSLSASSPTRSRDQNGQGAELKSEKMEIVDGPNGAGRIETVTVVNGVLQTSSAPSSTPAPQASGSTPAAAQGSSSSTTSTDDAPVAAQAQSMEAELREAGAVTQGELLRQEQEA